MPARLGPAPSTAPSLRARRRPARGLLLAAVTLGGVGALAAYAARNADRLLEVSPGALYRSRLLAPERLERVLRERGIRTVVNLQPASINALPWHAAEAEACRRAGALLVDLPLEAETPPSPQEVARFLALVDDPARRPVLVHCQHGVVRTGMLVAAFQVARLGWSNERALREMPAFGHDLDRPYRAPLRAFVLGFEPPVRSTAPMLDASGATPFAAGSRP